MSDTRINIPDAPGHLRFLLRMLPIATDGFQVSQHFHDPKPDEWFAGWGGADIGPYKSPEEALAAGIRRLYTLLQEARTDRDTAEDALAESQADVLRLAQQLAEHKGKPDSDDVPPAWSRAFDK